MISVSVLIFRFLWCPQCFLWFSSLKPNPKTLNHIYIIYSEMLSGCDLYLHLPPFQFLSTSFELWLNPSAKMVMIRQKNIKNLQVLFQFFEIKKRNMVSGTSAKMLMMVLGKRNSWHWPHVKTMLVGFPLSQLSYDSAVELHRWGLPMQCLSRHSTISRIKCNFWFPSLLLFFYIFCPMPIQCI